MTARPRIDLDGVSLVDEAGPPMVLAIFRYRAAEGLVLLVPESADVLVPFEQVEEASLDLVGGSVRIVFRESYIERQSWLRGARVLSGAWTDRFVMRGSDFPRRD
jgi:hypothetical protein